MDSQKYKKELRNKTLKLLKKFTGSQRIQAEKNLQKQLILSSEWQQAKCVALTISLPFEINTSKLITQAWKEQKQVAIPVTQNDRQMNFYQITPQTSWRISQFGIKEPINARLLVKEAIDLMIVPGIVYNKSGYRIGFGKGFYDRYLANFYGHTASLVFSFQVNNTWSPQAFDQKVQKLYIGE
ncbi:MAG: 5-formyltetrahydrofolate cyclo-ligase [Streptococcaceae bacterium]|jgi:5-formyltetrahydrofolate cyclo-ligase|nr:5-formyltetrahydrofolate cyclo-ligase [Streptococcaceae bacterium]